MNYKNDKLKELLEIVNIPEEEVEQLGYKEKQKYYKAKSKLGSVIHKSRDKNGLGVTYRKRGQNAKKRNISKN